jgi:hypothetical protein
MGQTIGVAMILLSPYKSSSKNDSSIVVARFRLGNNYSTVDTTIYDNYQRGDPQYLTWSGRYHTLEEAKVGLDKYLINNGYVLLTQEQWDNALLLL